jgi:hypothetical protein
MKTQITINGYAFKYLPRYEQKRIVGILADNDLTLHDIQFMYINTNGSVRFRKFILDDKGQPQLDPASLEEGKKPKPLTEMVGPWRLIPGR